MDPKELRGLMEAYAEMYAPIDENRMASRMEKMPSAPAKVGKATHSTKDLAPSKEPTPEEKAKARKALGLGEATAMAKRGKDETAIRNKIASSTGGGQSADRAGALADRPTYGQSGTDPKARANYARKQMGDFRKTNSSNPGLHGYGHKSNDPEVKAKQAARGAQRGSATLTPNEKKQLNMGEAVKGESSERRRDLAAQRRAGDKPLSPAKGRDNANKMQRDINYFDKLTKKNKNVVGLVSNEEVENYDEGYMPPTQKRADKMMKQVSKLRRTASEKGDFGHPEVEKKFKQSDKVYNFSKLTSDLAKKRDKDAKKSEFNEDIYDIILSHLLDEGYAETLEEAEWLMANVIDEEAIAIVIGEAQVANRDPDKYEREQSKKSAPVRGERTPMPPRGDKRREDFEKWYAANVR